MSADLVIYEKPTCTTCRNVNKVLEENGVDYTKVNYYVESLSAEKLKDLVGKMDISAAELVRKKESIYKELELSKKDLSEDEWIELMAQHPDLIQRPIAEKGDRAILARPAERIQEIL